jgi:hypothetical protein
LSILSEPLDLAAKTYLSAIGAAAIYISVENDKPVSVGAARDLDKALKHLRNVISPTVALGWVAWSPRYDVLVEIAQIPDLFYVERPSGFARLTLAELVGLIEQHAKQRGIVLTPHRRALERAQVYAKFLDDTLAALQDNGAFVAFNQAYKTHRHEAKARGESVQPFWAVMTDLRGVIIRALIANKKNRLDPSSMLEEIRKQFPWLARTVHNGRRKREKPNR